MKRSAALIFNLLLTITICHGQDSMTDLARHFLSCLQGNFADYTKSGKMKWNEIEAKRTEVWQAWADANRAFEEDKLPALRPLTNTDTLRWALPDSLEPNAVMPFYYGVKGENRPDDGLPLFWYIHGSGPKKHEWDTGYIICSRFDDAPSVYFIPQIPNEGKYYRWWQRSKLFAWERLLRQSLLNPEIDAKRIYLFGISEGGYGSQRLASYYADYLAGAGPMAGGEITSTSPAENCGHIGFSLLTGAEDYMFGRDLLTARTHAIFDSLELSHPGEYRHRIELIAGRGHSIDYTPTTPWLSQFRRTVNPKHFIWEDFPMDGQYRRGFYNIAVTERDTTGGNERTRYEMTIKDNTVTLTVDRVTYEITEREPRWNIPIKHNKYYEQADRGRFTLYLSEEMINVNKKVKVNVNGKEVFHGKVKPDSQHLINSCATFHDPLRLYPIGIEIKLHHSF